MANILVTTLPGYPVAFFRIIHYKNPTPSVTLPYRPIYNSSDVDGLLNYLNTTYKSANGFLGTFIRSGLSIIYQTHSTEPYTSGLFEVMLLTKKFRLHVNNPTTYGVYHEFYFWSWAVVIAWGDGTHNGYRDGTVDYRDYPSHTFVGNSQGIDVFHEDTIAIIISRDTSLLNITGTISKPLKKFVLTHTQIGLLDIAPMLEETKATLEILELRNSPNLKLFGLVKQWKLITAVNVSQCGLTRIEVDRVIYEMYLAAIAYPELRRRVDLYLTQTPAAPPTDATLAMRRIMQNEWGWLFF